MASAGATADYRLCRVGKPRGSRPLRAGSRSASRMVSVDDCPSPARKHGIQNTRSAASLTWARERDELRRAPRKVPAVYSPQSRLRAKRLVRLSVRCAVSAAPEAEVASRPAAARPLDAWGSWRSRSLSDLLSEYRWFLRAVLTIRVLDRHPSRRFTFIAGRMRNIDRDWRHHRFSLAPQLPAFQFMKRALQRTLDRGLVSREVLKRPCDQFLRNEPVGGLRIEEAHAII